MTLLDLAIVACVWSAVGLAWGVRYFEALVLGLELEGAAVAWRQAREGVPEAERVTAALYAHAVLIRCPPPPAWQLAVGGGLLWTQPPRAVGELHARLRVRPT